MLKEPGEGPEGATHLVDDETIATRARALASPVRWRILRACMPEALTNKELADLLGVNPGSMLHHVRTLVGTGFLAPGETRRGARNAIEIPYRTTDLVWAAGRSSAGFGDFLLEEVEVAETQGEARAWRTFIPADEALSSELQERLESLLAEFRDRGEALESAPRTLSVVVSLRPQSS